MNNEILQVNVILNQHVLITTVEHQLFINTVCH